MVKPYCNRAKNCKFSKKANDLDINSQKIVDQKFKELKEAKYHKLKSEEVEETSCKINTVT